MCQALRLFAEAGYVPGLELLLTATTWYGPRLIPTSAIALQDIIKVGQERATAAWRTDACLPVQRLPCSPLAACRRAGGGGGGGGQVGEGHSPELRREMLVHYITAFNSPVVRLK